MRWIGVAAVVVVLAGCGPEDAAGPAGDGDDPVGQALGDTEWVLTDGVPTVEGYPITLRVEDSRVGGTAACNSYGGDVTVSGDRIEVHELAWTEMGCPEPGVHDSEAAYLDALQAVERYERTDGQLVLSGPDVELRFEAAPPVEDASLTGTDWQLESLLAGAGPDAAASSVMAEATLRLDGDGALHATDGCNDLGGRWETDDDVLRVSDVVTTDVGCPTLDAQTQHVRDVLLGEPTVALDGRRLVLTAGDRGLEYRAP